MRKPAGIKMKYFKEDEDVAGRKIERFPTQDKRVIALFIISPATSVAFVWIIMFLGNER